MDGKELSALVFPLVSQRDIAAQNKAGPVLGHTFTSWPETHELWHPQSQANQRGVFSRVFTEAAVLPENLENSEGTGF